MLTPLLEAINALTEAQKENTAAINRVLAGTTETPARAAGMPAAHAAPYGETPAAKEPAKKAKALAVVKDPEREPAPQEPAPETVKVPEQEPTSDDDAPADEDTDLKPIRVEHRALSVRMAHDKAGFKAELLKLQTEFGVAEEGKSIKDLTKGQARGFLEGLQAL